MRGNNAEQAATIAATPTRKGLNLRHRGLNPHSMTRQLAGKPRIEDKEEWKKQENAWSELVVKQSLTQGTNAMKDRDSWAQHMQDFAEFPEYGMLNRIWAKAQINSKKQNGVDISDDALVLSPTWWEALGRRVKAEYLQPNWKFENQPKRKNWGYNHKRDWSDDYAIEQTQPFREWITIMEPVKDENGALQYNQQGEIIKRPKKGPFGAIKGYGTFIAYHENATEALNGGTPPELPQPSWHGATGDEKDAKKMLQEIRQIAAMEKVEIEFVDTDPAKPQSMSKGRLEYLTANKENSAYDYENKKIKINKNLSTADQAVVLLDAMMRHWDKPAPTGENADLASHKQLQRLGRQSTVHALASLYGIEDNQQFNGIEQLAEEKNGYQQLSAEVQRRMRSAMTYMHPVMKAKLQSDIAAAGERKEARKTRKTTKKK